MKNLFLFSFLIVTGLNGFAQTVNTISCENYATEKFKGVNIELPNYREISSGTKLIVTYEGEWPAEMQGAFEYAVKLWEEVLPMSLPINITAKIDAIRGSRNLLSKVSFDTYDFNEYLTETYASPMTLVKNVLLQEYHSGQKFRFFNEIYDTSILDGNDITITYNKNMINQFSFSLDGNPNISKYDFVTVALRDIAIGLGFTTSFTADTSKNELNITGSRLTPFESLVMESLHTTDPKTACVHHPRHHPWARKD